MFYAWCRDIGIILEKPIDDNWKHKKMFRELKRSPKLFSEVKVDGAGYGVSG